MVWTPWTEPGTSAIYSQGTSDWVNLSAVNAEDGFYGANASQLAKSETTDQVLSNNFGFSLPLYARAYQVQVRFKGYHEDVTLDANGNVNVMIHVDATTLSNMNGGFPVVPVGSNGWTNPIGGNDQADPDETERWGLPHLDLRQQKVNATDFGVVWNTVNSGAQDSVGNIYIDSVQMRLDWRYYLWAGQAAEFITALQDAELARIRSLAADPGSYTTAGQALDLLKTFRLQAERGNFNLAGQVADFFATRLMAADPGAFVTAGQVVDLRYVRGMVLTAGTGAFATAGVDIDLTLRRLMEAASGSFTTEGWPADIARQFSLMADAGAFNLEGQDLGFKWFRVLQAEAGTFVLVGHPADFRLIQVVDDSTLKIVHEFCASLAVHEQTAGLASIDLTGGA